MIDNILKTGSIEAEKIARKKVNDIKQKIIKIMNKCSIKPKTVYGDSVTSDTPILLRKNNMIYIKTIETLLSLNQFELYHMHYNI